MGSFSYTPRAEICLAVLWVGRLSYTHRYSICFFVRLLGTLCCRKAVGVGGGGVVRGGMGGGSLTRLVL